jgi:hypothetical protein
MLSQCWNGGGAGNFSDGGYVADSVGEEKFRRLVTGVGIGGWKARMRNGNAELMNGLSGDFGAMLPPARKNGTKSSGFRW